VEFYCIFRLSSSGRVCSTQGDIRTMHKIVVAKPRDNSPVGKSRRSRCSENSEVGLEERVGGVDWSFLAHNRNQVEDLCGFSGTFLGRLRDQ